jgi:DNA repair protein RadC
LEFDLRKQDIYFLIKKGRYSEAASLLIEESTPVYKKICSPSDVYPLLRKYGFKQKEYFIVVLLDGAHQVIVEKVVSIGLVNRTVVHPREIFYEAVLHCATAIILAHNHPSGNLDPSPEDREITEHINEASKIMGIPILDHIIISRNGYFSFVEHGLLVPYID